LLRFFIRPPAEIGNTGKQFVAFHQEPDAMARSPIAKNADGSIFVVRSGDTLTKLINEVHRMSIANHKPYVEQALLDNRHIRNADLIHPGQIVFLRRHVPSRPTSNGTLGQEVADAVRETSMLDPQTRDILEVAASFAFLAAKGSTDAFLNELKQASLHLASDLQSLIDEVLPDPARLKRHQGITAFQNSIVRRAALGSVEDIKFKAKRGVSFSGHLGDQVRKAGLLARRLRMGGQVIKYVDLPIICYDVALAKTVAEKNGVFVSRTTGWATGLGVGAGSLAVAALVLSGPVGWKLGLVIALGSGAVGMGAGLGTRKVYDTYGSGLDVVGALHVDRLCSVEVLPFAGD